MEGTYYFEEDDSYCIIDHAFPEDDREQFGLMNWTNKSEGSHRISGRDGCTILHYQTDVHVLVGLLLADGDDPLQIIDVEG